MGIDTSIIAKHPTLVVAKPVGVRGREGVVVEVLADGAGKCYDFFGNLLPDKFESVYTFKFLQAAAAAAGRGGESMSRVVLDRCGIINVFSTR